MMTSARRTDLPPAPASHSGSLVPEQVNAAVLSFTLLADPTHSRMSEQELVRALQSDRDGGQEERY